MQKRSVAGYVRKDARTGKPVQVGSYQRDTPPASPATAVDAHVSAAAAQHDPMAAPATKPVKFDELFGFAGRDLLKQGGPFTIEGWRAGKVYGNTNRLRLEHQADDENIFGPGMYLAAEQEGAEEYGDDPQRYTATLQNPKVVDISDEDVPMDYGEPDFAAIAEQMSWEAQQAQSHGHDSIIVQYPETVADEYGGETTYRREIFVFPTNADQVSPAV